MIVLPVARVVVDQGVHPNLVNRTKLGKQLPIDLLRDLVRLEARVNFCFPRLKFLVAHPFPSNLRVPSTPN